MLGGCFGEQSGPTFFWFVGLPDVVFGTARKILAAGLQKLAPRGVLGSFLWPTLSQGDSDSEPFPLQQILLKVEFDPFNGHPSSHSQTIQVSGCLNLVFLYGFVGEFCFRLPSPPFLKLIQRESVLFGSDTYPYMRQVIRSLPRWRQTTPGGCTAKRLAHDQLCPGRLRRRGGDIRGGIFEEGAFRLEGVLVDGCELHAFRSTKVRKPNGMIRFPVNADGFKVGVTWIPSIHLKDGFIHHLLAPIGDFSLGMCFKGWAKKGSQRQHLSDPLGG